RRRRAAASRPSAPLLPFPATTATRRPYAPPSIATARRATAPPARCTSTSVGSGAAWSMAFISSGVTTGITGAPPAAAARDRDRCHIGSLADARSQSQCDRDRVGRPVGVGERELPAAHTPVGGEGRRLAAQDEPGLARRGV